MSTIDIPLASFEFKRNMSSFPYAYQADRLAASRAPAAAMAEAISETVQREAQLIASGKWTVSDAEHHLATTGLDTSVMEQRTLALAHVLKDEFDFDLSHYDKAIDDAANHRPAVEANTVSKGITEPELKLEPGKQLGADDIAQWRRDCDRHVEHHRSLMYTRADELERHANRLEQKAMDLVDQVGEHQTEAALQKSILVTLRAHDDGSERYRYGIESSELKVALHSTRAEHSGMEAQRTELESQALRHEATATRRQADYDVEASKVNRLDRVERMIGQYWAQPGLIKVERQAIVEQQRLALQDAEAAYTKSKSILKDVDAAKRSADELQPSITKSRVELATLELTGKRLLADVQAVERGRMLLPTLDGAQEKGIGGNSFREIIERQRANQARPISERLASSEARQETVAGRSAGMGRK